MLHVFLRLGFICYEAVVSTTLYGKLENKLGYNKEG